MVRGNASALYKASTYPDLFGAMSKGDSYGYGILRGS